MWREAASFPQLLSPCFFKDDDTAERPHPACLTAQPPQLRLASCPQAGLFTPLGHGHTCGWGTRVRTLQHATPALSSPLHLAPFL